MNESMQEYRTILADNPAKAEKQLYKLAKKGDLNALSALNEYYEMADAGGVQLQAAAGRGIVGKGQNIL